MSLRHILLGLLEHPASGYDIKQEFDRSISFFWAADLAQIYPLLRKLEAEGLVTSQVKPSDKGPDRVVYKRTGAGKRELANWLASGPEIRTEKRHYLAQVFFLHNLGRTGPEDFLRSLKEEFETRVARLEDTVGLWEERFGKDYPDNLPDDEFYRHMVFELGQDLFQTYARWSKRCLDRLEDRL